MKYILLMLIALTLIGCKSEKTWSEMRSDDLKQEALLIQRQVKTDSIKTSSHYEIWQDSVYGK